MLSIAISRIRFSTLAFRGEERSEERRGIKVGLQVSQAFGGGDGWRLIYGY